MPKAFSLFAREVRGLTAAAVLGLIVAPAVLLAVTWEIHHEFQRSRLLRTELNLSYEERAQLQTVFSLVQDAETGQRGYIITGQKSFLTPYYAAENRIEAELAKLEAVEGPTFQAGELELQSRLKMLIDQKLSNLRLSIEVRDEEGAAAAMALVSTGHGKQLMDEIRVVVAALIAEERHALEARSAEDQARTARTESIMIGLFVALGALLALAYALVLRQARARTRLLAQVRTSAARQEAIFESAQDAVITFNPSGSIEALNRAGEAMFGRSRQDMHRRDIGQLIELSQEDTVFLQRLVGDGDVVSGVVREFTAKRPDGTRFPVEAAIGGLQLPDGLHLVAAIRDISERRRMEQMKAEFISTVSHELRTPLTSIAGSLGLLMGGAAGKLESKAERLLGIAHSNSQRLIRLINDILDMEKIESGKMTFSMAPVELGELARRAVEGMDGLASQAGVKFDLVTPHETSMVMGDADRLLQVAANLLSNAVKFSPPQGVVQLTVVPMAQRVRLTVRDNGPGIPEAFRSRIFSKFAQADASDTRQKGGTGLGLAISKEIVERHGGRLWFDSMPGEGSAFHIELGLIPAAAEPTASRGRVLICEDDADIAQVLTAMVEREGFTADTTASVAATEAALGPDHAYVALLLDVRLPDGNGLDLLQRLRGSDATRSLPVLIVSAEDGQAAALDVIDWMQKPVEPERLRAALGRLDELTSAARPRVLHVEDDPDVRQVVAGVLSSRCEVISVEGLKQAREAIAASSPDLVILDIALADGSGVDLLPELARPDGSLIPVIIFSAQAFDDEQAHRYVGAVLTKSRTSLDQLAGMVRRLAAPNTPKAA